MLYTADLHIHTVLSDGAMTPEEALMTSKMAGLRQIALTDHEMLQSITISNEISLIPGVEICCHLNGTAVEILGYGIDVTNKSLQDCIQTVRNKRVELLLQAIRDTGVEPPVEWQNDNLFRKDLPRLFNIVGITDYKALWAKYEPTYVQSYHALPAVQVATAIRDAGGFCVLAHPLASVSMPWENVIAHLALLRPIGIEVIELITPKHADELLPSLHKACKSLDLMGTVGSDTHTRSIGIDNSRVEPYLDILHPIALT